MANSVPLGEALPAMVAMITVLFFILFFYCLIPCYRAFQRRRYEREHWWENDPRWNNDRFNFTPQLPQDYQSDKKYSKLPYSRSSSIRSRGTIVTSESDEMKRDENDSESISVVATIENEVTPPPNYSDAATTSSSKASSSSSSDSQLSEEPSPVRMLAVAPRRKKTVQNQETPVKLGARVEGAAPSSSSSSSNVSSPQKVSPKFVMTPGRKTETQAAERQPKPSQISPASKLESPVKSQARLESSESPLSPSGRPTLSPRAGKVPTVDESAERDRFGKVDSATRNPPPVPTARSKSANTTPVKKGKVEKAPTQVKSSFDALVAQQKRSRSANSTPKKVLNKKK